MGYSSVTQRQPDAHSQMVRHELQRIIGSPPFRNSDRLVRFLTFVVEEALEGRGSGLKESLIGIEVFGRSTEYDPKTDPIVRVQARRLRAKLEAWYVAGGQTSAVRILLPKGGYAPEFGPVVTPAVVSTGPSRSIRRWWAWLLIAVAVAGAAVIVAMRPGPKPIAAGSRLFTAYRGYQASRAFSPDGSTLAFSWSGPDGDNTDIYVQSLDADTPRRLTVSPERERNPAWLPDGQHIAFLRDDGPGQFAAVVVPILGVGEKIVAELHGDLGAPPRMEWSRDGKKIYTSEPTSPGEPLRVVEIDLQSGARRGLVPPVTQGPAAGTPGDDEVALSPNGEWLAFRRRTASTVGDVFVAPAAGGDASAITHDRTGITGLAWTRDGESLIVSSERQSSLGRLWRFPLNNRQAPVCLTDAILAASYPAVSPRDGQIAFASRYYNTNVWRIDLKQDEPAVRVIASNLMDSSARYSPDGKRIVFRSNRTGNDDIWAADASGRSSVRLTDFGGPVTGSPHWAPNGQFLAFDSRPDGSADIFMLPAGGGRPRKLTADASNEVTPSFSADGKYIYFASDRAGLWQIWKQPVDGGAARQITAHDGFAPQESADGRWLYYTKLDRGGLFRRPVSGGDETVVLGSLPASLWGAWALSGSKVVFAASGDAGDAGPGSLKILDPETGGIRTVASLTFRPAQWDEALSVSPDGRYALVTEVERQGSEIHLQPDR